MMYDWVKQLEQNIFKFLCFDLVLGKDNTTILSILNRIN